MSRPPVHGFAKKEVLYDVWNGIKKRCFRKNNKDYHNYGGRGITVCDEWVSNYMTFRNWAIENGYSKGLSIDRIDNNGNYEPSNCKWSTPKQQSINRRTNTILSFNGKNQTMKEWAEEIGMCYHALSERISRGSWSIEKALTTPLRKNKNRKA